ncbi:DUF4365 domain-containing protein [Mariniflexile sp. HMF6888]|uniref:DUF4365 domain-containing protein n=1 Tax=Mariniflexile sp. HMF6888 TaxID=3373086 RepID=UPI00379FEAC4
MQKLPQRPQAHNNEELSERFFDNCLPNNWYSHKPDNDYGVDLIVDLFEGTDATGLELLVQLKSSENSNDAENETQTLRVATYNYLWRKLQVVLIVKYVVPDNEAYWILLKDVPSPNQDNETFTVLMPKENRLSDIDWEVIKGYVQEVTDRKLAAQNAHVQEMRNNATQQ